MFPEWDQLRSRWQGPGPDRTAVRKRNLGLNRRRPGKLRAAAWALEIQIINQRRAGNHEIPSVRHESEADRDREYQEIPTAPFGKHAA